MKQTLKLRCWHCQTTYHVALDIDESKEKTDNEDETQKVELITECPYCASKGIIMVDSYYIPSTVMR